MLALITFLALTVAEAGSGEWTPTNPKFTYGQVSANYSLAASKLRQQLLADYDRVVPPMSDRLGEYSSAGTDVFLEVRFIKVEEVSAALGSMRCGIHNHQRSLPRHIYIPPFHPIAATVATTPSLACLRLPILR